MSKISPSRIAAFEILRRIETENAFSSILLPQYEEKLSLKDRALCHQITLGVLRNKLYLDRVIEVLTKGKKTDSAIRTILEIGLFQLDFLDKVPDYSIINECVNLVQFAKKTSAKGFVNAVLRRAQREKISLDFKDETEKISVATSHPRWLLEKWITQFGVEKTFLLAKADNDIPQVCFRPTKKFSGENIQLLENYKKSEFVENCFVAEKFDEQLINLAENGEIYFQDEASQMLGSSIKLDSKQYFFDVCAAPGSKTSQISAKCEVPSAKLFAGDLYFSRLRFLRENCIKQNIDFVNFVNYDAEKSLPFADQSFDVVLIDAPCSGTGTIRHNPEIRYFLAEKDFGKLSAKQLNIIKNASKLVKRGGKLIYSTCSLEPEENEQVIEDFLKAAFDFEKIVPDVPARFLTESGFARTFPSLDNMDGFFISALRRK
ncbi:MAG: 16S rRNA (cytosine(967)-C(5))-methyltransferase RsmB [Pyrinomonadaceae bacterium]